MYKNDDNLCEAEVANQLIALIHGEAIENTLLVGSRATSYEDGGYLTNDEGFVLYTPDGSKFQITIKQEY